MDEIMRSMAELAVSLSVSLVSIAVPDLSAEAPAFSLRVGVWGPGASAVDWSTVPGSGTYCADVMRTSVQISIASTRVEKRTQTRALTGIEGMCAYLGTPVPAVTGGAIGTLAVHNCNERIWSRQNRQDLHRTAHTIGLILAPPALREQSARGR